MGGKRPVTFSQLSRTSPSQAKRRTSRPSAVAVVAPRVAPEPAQLRPMPQQLRPQRAAGAKPLVAGRVCVLCRQAEGTIEVTLGHFTCRVCDKCGGRAMDGLHTVQRGLQFVEWVAERVRGTRVKRRR